MQMHTTHSPSHEILTENLGMHRVATKFLLHLLSDDLKCVAVSLELIEHANANEKF